MRRIIQSMSLAVLLLLALQASAQTLRVAGAQFPRIFEQQGAGVFQGMGVELVQELAQRLGYDVQFELYPWPRALHLVESGQADVLVGLYKTAEQEDRFLFAETPFYQDEMVFYARKGSFNWDGNISMLHRRKIGVVAGWVHTTPFDAIKGSLNLSTVENVETGLRMLEFGRIDLLAADARNAEPFLNRGPWSRRPVALKPSLGTQVGYLAFPRKPRFEALRSDMDRVFQQLQANGTLKRLALKWSVALP
ncbi:substrate-binding periplasmic protein [Leeia aquatica]|uniref:Amino acid ABC transporter substrate-binding protein n=1 Tax=Leeia aquatica TaxID=2725557 RepID=A0A847S698_9NEIS|nr:transporter substrate-binding domain-containing protein [Leeia aquatica]NLR74335.1 amino acid ABC transporter substrate-binding protein [Leeia aquatica]